MPAPTSKYPKLPENGTVAVVGGGPAGAFFALHLLREARAVGRRLQVVVFEPRWLGPGAGQTVAAGCWKGCNHCAGGLSPRLCDELLRLKLWPPEPLIQGRIRTLTIQGYWKNIELDVPPGREMLTVFRGAFPARRLDRAQSFDAFLLREAARAGARVAPGRVTGLTREPQGRWQVDYALPDQAGRQAADFVAVACGVNRGCPSDGGLSAEVLERALPGFRPPKRRRVLVFELELGDPLPGGLAGALHFVEYGSRELRLEMCSIVPKQGFVTVVLVGASVDAARSGADNRRILEQFLALPHIRKLLPSQATPHAACLCTPWMVVGAARHYVGDGIAAVGDLVTTRLNKDGILSACEMARTLAQTIVRTGADVGNLKRGYEPMIRSFRRDNRFAAVVFLLHRVVFGSSVLSRVLYQAVIHERKTRPEARRRLAAMLWKIASGDDRYEAVFRSLWHPVTVWSILVGGGLITLRNYLTELFFGLRWEGFGRFTTGVALERLEAKRTQFARWLAVSGAPVPRELEFERMYTIKIAASRDRVFEELAQFGEPGRGFLNPRWVRVRRVTGEPNEPGCVIQYRVFHRRFCFHLRLERVLGRHLVVYRVLDGFARGGVLVFEIERDGAEGCSLSIYVAFNFPRGKGGVSRGFWWTFRHLFPAFVHDVLWNHSLCQFKDLVKAQETAANEAVKKPAVSPDQRPPDRPAKEARSVVSASVKSG